MRNKNYIITIIIIVVIMAGAVLLAKEKGFIRSGSKTNSGNSNQSQNSNQQAKTIEYVNTQYGFKVALPQDWKGYSIVNSSWQGYTINATGEVPSERGPMISIRNPLWTEKNPYQDIPIMIFTLQQWDNLQRDQFHIGAAPINPSMLNYNDHYVFALPARYNYAFPSGWQEVDKIIEGKPVQPLQQVNFNSLPANDQILLCTGIPNDSNQTVSETTRLFINLPKDIFKDKDHNLQFKTVSGNAQATWISNAGPYGQAFQANENCWSYFYELDGTGKLDLTSKSAVPNQPDYLVHFTIESH